MFEALQREVTKKMEDSLKAFEANMRSLRTGRASPSLLDGVEVEAYGNKMPLTQLATVTAQGALTLNVQVWDVQMAPAVEKALRESNLGLNPQVAGPSIRLILPDMTEERRKELVKKLSEYAEKARIALRSARQHGMDGLKKAEQKKELSEDERHLYEKSIQTLTDKMVKKVSELTSSKEKDLMAV